MAKKKIVPKSEGEDAEPIVPDDNIAQYVRKAENDYVAGTTRVSKYVNISQYETINKIDAYLNSKHISGETDSQGREKPFFNIVTAAVNVWYRATDIDRKNIKIISKKSKQDIPAFMATVKLQNWMNGSKSVPQNFGQYLNKWGRVLAKYGSAVSKFVEKNGELHMIVVPWNRIICDTIDFYQNPVIEKLQFTAAGLRKQKGYDQGMVEKLIEAVAARKDLNHETKDTRNYYIEVYEVHGEFPLSYVTGKDSDKGTYAQQMHVISYLATKENSDEFEDFTLYSGKEADSPYDKDDLIEEDEQTLAIGAVQNLFEAQWMTNHTVKQIKDQLDLASKLIFQTSDGNFVGQNALDAIETGDILIHQINQPLTTLTNTSHDIAALESFGNSWQTLGNQINGVSSAMLGMTGGSKVSARMQQLLLQESYALFELMTENKGLAIEQKLRKRIIPFLKKQMDTSEEIAGTLDSYDITKIDSMYVPNEAIRRHNKIATQAVLQGKKPPVFDQQAMEGQVKSELQPLGNQRFFKPSEISSKTWKQLFEDLEWEVEIDVTGEQKDTQAVMDALNTALQIFVKATPEQLADPNFKLIFNKILERTAEISPIQIASIPPTPPPAPTNKVAESLNYKDAPPDVQRQIESQAGLKPSQVNPNDGSGGSGDIAAPPGGSAIANPPPLSTKAAQFA